MLSPDSMSTSATFDLNAVVGELRGDVAYRKNGHLARTLARGDDLRIVVVAMRAGSKVSEHHVNDTVCLQTLAGTIHVRLPDGVVDLRAGQVLVMARGLRHQVEAAEDSAFVITLGWRAA